MSGDDSGDRSGSILGRIARTITPGFIRRRFAVKFGIAVLVLGLLVGAVGFAGSEVVKQEFRQEVNDQFASLATSEASSLRQWIQTNSQEAAELSRVPVVQNGGPEEIQSWLDSERSVNNNWGIQVIVHYVDVQNGTILASSDKFGFQGEPTSALNESVVAALERVESGVGVVRSEAYVGEATGSTTMRIAWAKAVTEKDGKAVVYSVTTESFASASLGDQDRSGVTMVVDGRNRIIMEKYGTSDFYQRLQRYDQPTRPIDRSRELGEADATAILMTNSAGGVLSGSLGNKQSEYQLNDRQYVVGAAKVPGISTAGMQQTVDWVVITHSNRDVAYGEVESVANITLLGTFVGVLIIGLFGAVLGRNTATAVDNLKVKAQEMEEGNLDVDFYSPRVDQIGRLYEGFANMRDALKGQIQEAEQARKEAEVSRAEALEMSNYLQEKADEYAQIMQQCGAGDLTRRMEPDGENEAMDRIAGEFNDMIDELEKTTGQLKSFADEVETAGEVVQTSSESVRDASEQVADSIQRISDDAYDQRERLEDISRTVDEVAADIESFAAEHDVDFRADLDRIEEISSTLSEMVDLSEETMAEAENVAGAAEEQAAELNEVTQRAEDLARYARPLREVLDRFETESEHEFYFPTGPGSGDSNIPDTDD